MLENKKKSKTFQSGCGTALLPPCPFNLRPPQPFNQCRSTRISCCVYLSMQVPWRKNKDDKERDWSLFLINLFFPPFLLLHSITFKATQNSVPFQLNTTCQILELEGSHRNRSRAWVPAGKQKIRAKASPLEGLMQWTFLFLNLSCCVNELGVTQQRRWPELNPSQVWIKTPPGFCFLHITPINSHSNRTTKQIQTEHAI